MRRHTHAIVTLLLLGLVAAGCGGSRVPADRPTLMFFNSEHWAFCKELMPVVNGLEREYRGELGVVYVSLDEADGREIARGYGVIGTPTFLLLDGQGDQVQVLRGSIPVQIIEQAVEDLVKQQGAD